MILLITQLDNTLHASIVFQTTFCRAVPCPSKFPCSLDRMVLLSNERQDVIFLACRYAKEPERNFSLCKWGVEKGGWSRGSLAHTTCMIINLLLFPTHIIITAPLLPIGIDDASHPPYICFEYRSWFPRGRRVHTGAQVIMPKSWEYLFLTQSQLASVLHHSIPL